MSYSKFYDDIKAAKMSIRAKVLYTVLLDKYELSEKKGFTNAKGEVICKMKKAEMAQAMGCCVRSVTKYIDELKLHNLISIELGLCKMYEIQVFQIGKICTFKKANFALLKEQKLHFQKGKNCTSLTYKPDPISQLSKPNARMRMQGSEQNELSQNERASSHSFSPSELGEQRIQNEQQEQKTQNELKAQSEPRNSRIPSGTPSQAQTQTPSANQTSSQAQSKSQAPTQAQALNQAPSQTPSQTQAQDKTQELKSKREWLGMSDRPSYISEQVWQDFCAYKRERRHNFTPTGKKAFFAKLDEIQASSNACELAINNTMANGWQGVFMPRLDNRQGNRLGKAQSMKPAQVVDALQEWLSDRQAQVIESELALPNKTQRRA